MAKEEATNFYNPDDESDDVGSSGKGSRTTITWTASEFIQHERGAGWYLLLCLATAATAAIIYLLTHERFAAGIVVILGAIVGVFVRQKPRQVAIEISATQIKIEDKSYPFVGFKSFSVQQEGALRSITFIPIKRLGVPISVFIEPANETKIVDLVGERLPLDNRPADRFDSLTRRLKI